MPKKKSVKESLIFQAEVNKLLDLVANSLYSEREIFLRELISNSADACEKIRYLSIKSEGLLGNNKDLSIHIRVSKKRKDGTYGTARYICKNCVGKGIYYEATKVVAGFRIGPRSVYDVSANGFRTDSETLQE